MAVDANEKLNRAVAFSVANGLRGASENKHAKRIEAVAGSDRKEILKTLTLVEREPGLSASCFRLIATAKAILNGDDSKRQGFDELVAYMNGMDPHPRTSPTEEPRALTGSIPTWTASSGLPACRVAPREAAPS